MNHYIYNWSVKLAVFILRFLNTLIKAYRPVIISCMENVTADLLIICLSMSPTSVWF